MNLLRLALADPEVLVALQGSRRMEEFVEIVHTRAQTLDPALTRSEVAASLQAPREDGMCLDALPGGHGWLPVAVDWREGAPAVQWCWLGRRRLTEPFFSDSIKLARRQPFGQLVQPTTSLEALERHVDAHPGLPLRGLIAHVSRCGSTLLSQMLACLPELVVVSEPPAFDGILREGPDRVARSVRVRWLRAMASALGQRREGEETGVVMKLDSWHLAHLPLIREAFPEVPCLILYREPGAVLASHMREPGLQMAGGIVGAPFDQVPFPGASVLDYRARVLSLVFAAAARAPEDALLVSYAQLPGAVRTLIAPFLGLRIDAAAAERMRKVERHDAKLPATVFSPRANSGEKTIHQDHELVATAERWIGESYRALEARRRESELHV